MDCSFENEQRLLAQYHPELPQDSFNKLLALIALYNEWNQKINVVSRKDMDLFFLHHVMHSLSIYHFIKFVRGSNVMDLGTGGGFPGIPLAIVFPEVEFLLVDSIGKKIKVVDEVVSELGLTNVQTIHGRAEEVKRQFDFVVTRAVAPMQELLQWTTRSINSRQQNAIPNGLIALKGGDLREEMKAVRSNYHIEMHSIFSMYSLPYFETKYLTYGVKK
jgi:16S rRNA (guanine527-N7)-methyltransferase